MQPNGKAPLKKAVPALASVLVVLLLFGLAGSHIIGLKLLVALFSLVGIGWAILGITNPDRMISGSKTPEKNAKDREDMVYRCRLLLVVCCLLLVLIFVSRRPW